MHPKESNKDGEGTRRHDLGVVAEETRFVQD